MHEEARGFPCIALPDGVLTVSLLSLTGVLRTAPSESLFPSSKHDMAKPHPGIVFFWGLLNGNQFKGSFQATLASAVSGNDHKDSSSQGLLGGTVAEGCKRLTIQCGKWAK